MTDPKISAKDSHAHVIPIIGLTGGMGSGKSSVAKIFESLGAIAIDADHVARQLRKPETPTGQNILTEFGTLDSSALRAILAQNPENKKKLEAILHPAIKIASDLAIQEALSKAPKMVIYEATLLIEAGRAQDFTALVGVGAPIPIKMERLKMRDPSTPKAVLIKMIESQLADQERKTHCRYWIENDSDLNHLQNQSTKVFEAILKSC